MLSTFGGLTLGLSAHVRPPAVGPIGSDLAGTFFANTGISTAGKATWNFDFYIDNSLPNGGLNAYTYKLSYGTDTSFVSFNPRLILDNAPLASSTTAGNSENLGFGFLGTPIGFNLNANEDYAFVLEAFSLTDVNQSSSVAKSAINVRVGTGRSVPDTGSTFALLGVAFAGIAGLRRKFAA